MATNDEVISLEEAVEALRRSGYLLEDRIDSLLRSQKYFTVPNAAYPDPNTGKSRELDIRAHSIAFRTDRQVYGVMHELLIECVNNPQPVILMEMRTPGVEPGPLAGQDPKADSAPRIEA